MRRSFSSKSAAVYKNQNCMIFSLRYDDISFSKWRPSAILELFYHHTRPRTKFLLLYAAACQISSQSDTQIWRYSYLNFFAYLAWNAYSGPQNGVFGGLWTPKCDYSSSRPPKAHPCVNLRLISRVCKYGYPLSGYPDLSTNFMAAENLDILKWKSGFFGCMKIVKNHACEFVMVRYISEFHSPLLTAVSLHLHVMSMYRLYQGTLTVKPRIEAPGFYWYNSL